MIIMFSSNKENKTNKHIEEPTGKGKKTEKFFRNKLVLIFFVKQSTSQLLASFPPGNLNVREARKGNS